MAISRYKTLSKDLNRMQKSYNNMSSFIGIKQTDKKYVILLLIIAKDILVLYFGLAREHRPVITTIREYIKSIESYVKI